MFDSVLSHHASQRLTFFTSSIFLYRVTEGSVGDLKTFLRNKRQQMSFQTNQVWRKEHMQSLFQSTSRHIVLSWGLKSLILNNFRQTSLSFEPSKSGNRSPRICDLSEDPTMIHEIWKSFLEGTVVHRSITDDPFVLLARERYPSWCCFFLQSVSIKQRRKGIWCKTENATIVQKVKELSMTGPVGANQKRNRWNDRCCNRCSEKSHRTFG